MSRDRLEQLRKQQALIETHLNWIKTEIDQEIEIRSSASPAFSDRPPLSIDDSHSVTDSRETGIDIESSTTPQVATDLYTQLGPDTRSSVESARRGCLVFSAASFSLLTAGIFYILFFYK